MEFWKTFGFLFRTPKTDQRSSPYKMTYGFSTRKAQSEKLALKYPTKIPVIIEKADKCRLPNLNNNNYVFNNKITIGELISYLRTNLRLDNTIILYVTVDDYVPKTSCTLMELSNNYLENDGFLYITYGSE